MYQHYNLMYLKYHHMHYVMTIKNGEKVFSELKAGGSSIIFTVFAIIILIPLFSRHERYLKLERY